MAEGACAGGRPVYFVDGGRTPFLKARGTPGPFRAADLAVAAGSVRIDASSGAPRIVVTQEKGRQRTEGHAGRGW